MMFKAITIKEMDEITAMAISISLDEDVPVKRKASNFKIEKALSDYDKAIGWDIFELQNGEWEWMERFEKRRWAKEALKNYLDGKPMMPD